MFNLYYDHSEETDGEDRLVPMEVKDIDQLKQAIRKCENVYIVPKQEF